MAERDDANVPEIVICQPAQSFDVDRRGRGNAQGVSAKTNPTQPTVDIHVQSTGLCQRRPARILGLRPNSKGLFDRSDSM